MPLLISHTLVEKERGIFVINNDTWENIHTIFVLYYNSLWSTATNIIHHPWNPGKTFIYETLRLRYKYNAHLNSSSHYYLNWHLTSSDFHLFSLSKMVFGRNKFWIRMCHKPLGVNVTTGVLLIWNQRSYVLLGKYTANEKYYVLINVMAFATPPDYNFYLPKFFT